MIVLGGLTIVLPDRLLSPGTIRIDGERIVEITAGGQSDARDLSGLVAVPGFIDVHVHGVEGTDTLDNADAIAAIAARLPAHGVTAFCPTSIACVPAVLRRMLGAVRRAREEPAPHAARVLPAHLESNFINPQFKGAQPASCICLPHGRAEGDFTGAEILAEIAAAEPDVGIITLAPEVDGVLDLVPALARRGHRVSLGHSGASYEEAVAAIDAGARQATHLFNRMTPLHHRVPGLAGAVLESDAVAAELICDGVHVHPAMVRAALACKGPSKVMAITDGTAGSGLARGSSARLGGRAITVGDAAYLEDGTLAGSVLTMDRAFALLVKAMDIGPVAAAQMCATTPARELGLHGLGALAPGAIADIALLDADQTVVETYIGGIKAFSRI